ncbi:DUF2314 domain-containing protein [Terriglobus sp. RCC_193]|uniref:DUF2314 domain-containing protein n=1 Tax=Terriglobus sp. RCC_193 TaxID=3239218 RepID=UPI003523C63C
MPEDDENLVAVSGDNDAMYAAINEARATFRQFLDQFFAQRPNQTSFLVKICFEDGDAVEHVWMADLDLASDPPTGVVANEPQISTLTYMQRVPINLSQLSDWMYFEDECLVGGFTTRALSSSTRGN